MTRAVIKLASNISYAMPIMDRVIEGCSYSEAGPIAAFRYKDFSVVVQSDEIIIFNAGDEASAIEVMSFLKDIVSNADKKMGKVRTY